MTQTAFHPGLFPTRSQDPYWRRIADEETFDASSSATTTSGPKNVYAHSEVVQLDTHTLDEKELVGLPQGQLTLIGDERHSQLQMRNYLRASAYRKLTDVSSSGAIVPIYLGNATVSWNSAISSQIASPTNITLSGVGGIGSAMAALVQLITLGGNVWAIQDEQEQQIDQFLPAWPAVASRLREIRRQLSVEPDHEDLSPRSLACFRSFLEVFPRVAEPMLSSTPDGNVYATWNEQGKLFSANFLNSGHVRFIMFRTTINNDKVRIWGITSSKTLLSIEETRPALAWVIKP